MEYSGEAVLVIRSRTNICIQLAVNVASRSSEPRRLLSAISDQKGAGSGCPISTVTEEMAVSYPVARMKVVDGGLCFATGVFLFVFP
ncbi:hypothetical protein GN956_G19585 [Arapaima gigas]